MIVLLEPLLRHLPAWLLVFFRLAGIFVMGPLFGSKAIPARLKIFLALGLSFCIYPILLTPGSASAQNIMPMIDGPLTLVGLIPAVAKELLIGLVIGYGVGLPLIGVQVGGKIIDQQLGLGIAGIFNPDIQEQTGIVSEFYYVAAIMIFLICGGHRVVLATLVGSFSHIPLGGFSPTGSMLDLIIGLLAAMFDIGLRIAAPLLCLIFLTTVAMGFIARTVPQMNILSIGFALRILAGTFLIIGVLSIEMNVFRVELGKSLEAISLFFNPAHLR